MKRFLLALSMVAFLFTGCNGVQSDGPASADKILKTTNAIYLDIRTVVTDPEVKPLFTAEELERLAELEQKYLEVADTLRAFPKDAEAIEKLSWIATEILLIMNNVEYIEKYRPYMAAIRISIKLLRNHI